MQKFRPSMNGTLRKKQKIQGSQLRFQTDFPFLQKGIPHSSLSAQLPKKSSSREHLSHCAQVDFRHSLTVAIRGRRDPNAHEVQGFSAHFHQSSNFQALFQWQRWVEREGTDSFWGYCLFSLHIPHKLPRKPYSYAGGNQVYHELLNNTGQKDIMWGTIIKWLHRAFPSFRIVSTRLSKISLESILGSSDIYSKEISGGIPEVEVENKDWKHSFVNHILLEYSHTYSLLVKAPFML